LAASLLIKLIRLGFELNVRGSTLLVHPPQRLDPILRKAITENKAELLKIVPRFLSAPCPEKVNPGFATFECPECDRVRPGDANCPRCQLEREYFARQKILKLGIDLAPGNLSDQKAGTMTNPKESKHEPAQESKTPSAVDQEPLHKICPGCRSWVSFDRSQLVPGETFHHECGARARIGSDRGIYWF
jgi:hypothetical protein